MAGPEIYNMIQLQDQPLRLVVRWPSRPSFHTQFRTRVQVLRMHILAEEGEGRVSLGHRIRMGPTKNEEWGAILSIRILKRTAQQHRPDFLMVCTSIWR